MVESCKVGLDHRLDCHQRTQGTIVAAWDNSFSGVKLCLIKRCYVVMQRHGVVMGPQAVCTVTAELSRPEGKTMGKPASPIHLAANLKPNSKPTVPFSKHHTQKINSKKEQSFAPKAALQN